MPFGIVTSRVAYAGNFHSSPSPQKLWSKISIVILKAFYPLVLTVFCKLGVPILLCEKPDTLGRIIFIHLLRSTVLLSLIVI